MVILPWPPRELSPNWRGHWAAKARKSKAYRKACWGLAKEAKLKAPDSQEIPILVQFAPPDNRARDWDNMLASVKAGLDGVADALGINDSRFRITIQTLGATKGGAVVLTIGEG